MADFMRVKYENPNSKQSQLSNQIVYQQVLDKDTETIKYAFTIQI